MKICPVCGERYPDDANFCPMDASKLQLLGAPAAPVPAVDQGAIGGRFALGERLGGAATGEVYAARDNQTGASVVVKLCHGAVFPSPITLERTQRELRQLQRGTCGSIATIIDQGRVPDGRLYVAMEPYGGQPLSTLLLAGGPMPFARARAIIMMIGEALGEAQKVGVVHRDVAPKNVLIGPNDQIKLINFGIALRVNDRVFGVPEYLAPEQVEGRPVDQRANIYSLGALLYHMLVGAPPYQGSADAVLKAHLDGQMVAPSARLPELGPDVDRVVLRALERSASRRPLTLRQFLSELEALPAQPVPGGLLDVTQRDLAPPGALAQSASGAAPTPVPPVPIPPGAAPLPGMPPFVAPMAAPGASPAYAPPAGRGPGVAPGYAAPTPHAMAGQLNMPGQVGPAPVFAPPFVQPLPQTVAVPAASPPAAAAPAPAAVDAAEAPKGGFRETLWFKKGEVDEYLKQATGQSPDAAVEDARPIEDRYADDGSLTADDRAKFSLRSGGPPTGRFARTPSAGAVPGDRMSEKELAEEYTGKKGSGAKVALIVVAIVIALGVVVALTVFLGRNKDEPKPEKPAVGLIERGPTAAG